MELTICGGAAYLLHSEAYFIGSLPINAVTSFGISDLAMGDAVEGKKNRTHPTVDSFGGLGQAGLR